MANNPKLLDRLSEAEKRRCAALVGEDARPPAAVAEAEGVSLWAVYKSRSRAEEKLGVRLPRMHRVGRPPRRMN